MLGALGVDVGRLYLIMFTVGAFLAGLGGALVTPVRRIVPGMTRREVRELLGRPRRTEIRSDLRKPVESWFYGPADSYALSLVDGRVFAVASTRIAS